MSGRAFRVCLGLFLLSLVLRAAFLLFVTGVDTPLGGDEPDYHRIAVSFLAGTGWQSGGRWSYRPPLISGQLVALYAVVGPNTHAARWLMVLISSLASPALFLVALKLLPDRFWAAVSAGVVWAIYPPSIFWSGYVLTENMAVLLSVVSLGAFLGTSTTTRRCWPAAVTGLLWGLSTLNRSVHLLLPLALLGIQIVLSHLGDLPWRWSWRHWLIGLAAFLMTLLPWTVRNYQIHGVIMPTTSGTGWMMMMCNATLDHPAVQDGLYYKKPEHIAIMSEAATEVEWDQIGRELALNEIQQHWRLLPKAVFSRAVNFWIPRRKFWSPTWSTSNLVMLMLWVPILALFALSFRIWSWRSDWPALVMIIYAFVFTLPFWGIQRFRFPVDPFIILRAMVAGAIFVPRVQWLTQHANRDG